MDWGRWFFETEKKKNEVCSCSSSSNVERNHHNSSVAAEDYHTLAHPNINLEFSWQGQTAGFLLLSNISWMHTGTHAHDHDCVLCWILLCCSSSITHRWLKGGAESSDDVVMSDCLHLPTWTWCSSNDRTRTQLGAGVDVPPLLYFFPSLRRSFCELLRSLYFARLFCCCHSSCQSSLVRRRPPLR
jgi:hypothetical protein